MPFGHAVASALPKAMSTIVRISSTVTLPSSLQSPMHDLEVDVGGTALVGVHVMVATGVTLSVLVGVGVLVAVLVGVGVDVSVGVAVSVAVAVGV